MRTTNVRRYVALEVCLWCFVRLYGVKIHSADGGVLKSTNPDEVKAIVSPHLTNPKGLSSGSGCHPPIHSRTRGVNLFLIHSTKEGFSWGSSYKEASY